MKRTFILLSVLVFLITTPALSASKSGGTKYALSVGIGTGIPVSPNVFQDDYDPSFGGVLDFEAARWRLAISASVDYNFFIANGLDPDDVNVLTAFLNLKLKPVSSGSLRPYLLAGGGLFRYWVVDLDLSEETTGWQFGGGVEIDISKSQSLFLDAKYVEGRTRDTNDSDANTVLIPIRLGVNFIF